MTIEEKAAKTVKKLLADTRRNRIKWQVQYGTDDFPVSREMKGGRYYYATVEELRVRVYEEEHLVSHDGDNFSWDSKPCVEIIDINHAPLWKLPRTTEMWDLLNTVEIKANNVEGLMDKFLGQDE